MIERARHDPFLFSFMISLKMELWVVFLNASFSIYGEREFTARLTAYDESIVTVTL